MEKVLLDSDVILDFFLKRPTFKNDANKIISLVERKKITGYITPVICANLYYIFNKEATKDEVLNGLRYLISMVDIIDISSDVVKQVLHNPFLDFEDALQYTAAKQFGQIEAIITRNTKDFKASKLPILTPAEFLASVNSTS